MTQVTTDLVTFNLLSRKAENYDQICELFKIPDEERSESHTAKQIIERIKTFLTGYIARRSSWEKHTQAAFIKPESTPLPDPDFTGFEEKENGKEELAG